MNNFCRNCGQKLSQDINFCEKCGAKIIEERINVEEVISAKKKEKNIISILIMLFGLSIIAYYYSKYSVLDFIAPLLFLASIITLITARIKMEYSKIIKILFNAIIIVVSSVILLILSYMIICEGGIRIV